MYGRLSSGLRMTSLSRPPISNPAPEPPICRPVFARILVEIKTRPYKFISVIAKSLQRLTSSAQGAVVSKDGFKQVDKALETLVAFTVIWGFTH